MKLKLGNQVNLETAPMGQLHEAASADAVLDSYAAHLVYEMRLVFAFRLIPLLIVYAFLIAGSALNYGISDVHFLYHWLIIGAFQLLQLRLLCRQKSFQSCCAMAFCSVVGCLCWWFLLPYYGIGTSFIWMLLLGYVVIGFGFMPWPLRHNLTLASMFLLTALVLASVSSYSTISALLACMLILVALDFAAENYMTTVSRISHSFLAAFCDSSHSIVSKTVRLLAWELVQVADSDRVLLTFGDDKAEVIASGRICSSRVDKLFIKGICQVAADVSADHGVIQNRALSDDFTPVLSEWFGIVPRSLMFATFTTVIENAERKVSVFVPFGVTLSLAGARKAWAIFSSLVALARISVSSARTRFVSSDALETSERLIAKRDDEINHVVHLVNNAAQDVTAICDELRRSSSLNAGTSVSGGECWLIAVRELESAARSLSAGVSDVKLVSDMLRIRSLSRFEHVALQALLEDIENNARYLLRRGCSELKIVSDCPLDAALKVVSREFLETCLRLLVKRVSQRCENAAAAMLEVSSQSSNLVFVFKGPAEGCKDAAWTKILAGSQGSVVDVGLEDLSAVANFARLCRGQFERLPAGTEYSAAYKLTLPFVSLSTVSKVASGKWVLFVDDNPQVLSFYGRVAEALSINYVCASSYEEALRIFEEREMPSLLVTDIQLGAASGLDLLKYASEHFGKKLRLIVVSGFGDDSMRSKAAASGADLFLSKPVSRARLFSEIQHMI